MLFKIIRACVAPAADYIPHAYSLPLFRGSGAILLKLSYGENLHIAMASEGFCTYPTVIARQSAFVQTTLEVRGTVRKGSIHDLPHRGHNSLNLTLSQGQTARKIKAAAGQPLCIRVYLVGKKCHFPEDRLLVHRP